MRFACTIGSYHFPDFIELNILCCRRVFGSDVPILVSDDLSSESGAIAEVCAHLGVCHTASDSERGHFAGDMQSTVNALSFAQERGADIALKISQRFLLIDPLAAQIISQYFASPAVWLGLPGRVPAHSIVRPSSRFFAQFPILTDLIAIRTSTLEPEYLKEIYEGKVRKRAHFMDGYVESLWRELMETHFANHYVILNELTVPDPRRHPQDPIFLRRYTHHEADFQKAALAVGLPLKHYNLCDWKELNAAYRPLPAFAPV